MVQLDQKNKEMAASNKESEAKRRLTPRDALHYRSTKSARYVEGFTFIVIKFKIVHADELYVIATTTKKNDQLIDLKIDYTSEFFITQDDDVTIVFTIHGDRANGMETVKNDMLCIDKGLVQRFLDDDHKEFEEEWRPMAGSFMKYKIVKEDDDKYKFTVTLVEMKFW